MTETTDSPLKIVIKGVCGVGHWRWITDYDTCGICQLAFESCCPDCDMPGNKCPMARGECTHCFHEHCIKRWINTLDSQRQCPLCRQKWSVKKT